MPSFVLPAIGALRWAAFFVIGMLAVPAPHHTWAWLCLLPFSWHFAKFLRGLDSYIRMP